MCCAVVLDFKAVSVSSKGEVKIYLSLAMCSPLFFRGLFPDSIPTDTESLVLSEGPESLIPLCQSFVSDIFSAVVLAFLCHP